MLHIGGTLGLTIIIVRNGVQNLDGAVYVDFMLMPLKKAWIPLSYG